jgi:hypothetical protein
MFTEHGPDYIDSTQENARLEIHNSNNYIFIEYTGTALACKMLRPEERQTIIYAENISREVAGSHVF